MSVDKSAKRNILQFWKSRISSIGAWLLMLFGVAGVTLLLMVFAGVFHPKVPSKASTQLRPIPTDASFAEVKQVTQPRYESATGAVKPVHEANVA